MFSLVLTEKGKHRLVYSTSIGFRMVYLSIALLIFLPLITYSDGSIFKSANIIALSLCAICLLSSLFLERWVFDKDSNFFEKNVGLILLYGKKRRPMDTLQSVVLDEFRKGDRGDNVKPRRQSLFGHRTQSLIAHRTIVLYLQDRDGEVYKLDIVRGLGLEKLRKQAERLSDFCGIPFEDRLPSPSETLEEGDL